MSKRGPDAKVVITDKAAYYSAEERTTGLLLDVVGKGKNRKYIPGPGVAATYAALDRAWDSVHAWVRGPKLGQQVPGLHIPEMKPSGPRVKIDPTKLRWRCGIEFFVVSKATGKVKRHWSTAYRLEFDGIDCLDDLRAYIQALPQISAMRAPDSAWTYVRARKVFVECALW